MASILCGLLCGKCYEVAIMSGHALFEYLCRDACNNKVYGTVLLKGAISPEDVEKFTKLFNDQRWFIAEQIGITSLMPELWKFGGGPNNEDFPFHEFIAFADAFEDVPSDTEWGSIGSFIECFDAVQSKWDISISKCSRY